MYLRITERRNRDGSTVAYYALAENSWTAAAKRAEARVVHNFGRADEVDRDGLRRLINSIRPDCVRRTKRRSSPWRHSAWNSQAPSSPARPVGCPMSRF